MARAHALHRPAPEGAGPRPRHCAPGAGTGAGAAPRGSVAGGGGTAPSAFPTKGHTRVRPPWCALQGWGEVRGAPLSAQPHACGVSGLPTRVRVACPSVGAARAQGKVFLACAHACANRCSRQLGGRTTPGFPLGPEPPVPTRGGSPAGPPWGQGDASRGKFAQRGVEGCSPGSSPRPSGAALKAGSGSSSDPCPHCPRGGR